MKLKRLELNGFKSFADKTEIVFGDGITGIVGPNGSGKSNIGDAVRWVLGEQSPKTLRGAKMEDVIFGGTQTRRRSSYCEVTLLFDNEDGKLKSAYSEVSVTRRVYRNGDSEYMLNHVNCRLKDIQELFRDTGIGREGYSLIGQGRIDEILSQKSEDRRQVFEEAAGIMTYRFRKEEAERKLNRTTENLSRVYDIINEIEGRLNTLGAEAEVAKEYRTLFDRMRFLEANIFLVRHDRLNERITQLTQSIEGLRDAVMNGEARLSSLNAQREEADELLSAIEEELSAARLKYSDQLQQTHDAELLAEKAQHAAEQIRHDKEQAETQYSQLASEADQLTETLTASQNGSAALEEQIKNLQSEYDAATRITAEDQRAADEAEDALNSHKADILSAVRQQMDVREAQSRQLAIREQMQQRITELETSLQSMRLVYDDLNSQTEKDRQKHTEIVASNAVARRQHEETEKKLAELSRTVRQTTEEAQKKQISLQADISRLKLMEEMSRDLTGYQQSVKKALEYAGQKPGVYGVLAKLIEVPPQLEVAIDMVLGGALQNIVTDTEDTAKKIIDYLRQNRLGRATFLPITSVRGRVLSPDERRLLTMPGCLGVASELIRYQSKFNGIIENLLGRTVIADTLDHGIPIMRAGHHAFRLVTLNGDVMHSGGSMTGGTAQNRSVSLLGREREIKELRQRIDSEKETLEQLNQNIIRLNSQYEESRREDASKAAELQQLEIQAAQYRERVSSDEEDAKEYHQRIEAAEASKTQLEAAVEEINRDLAETEKSADHEASDNAAMEQKTVELQQAMIRLREKAESSRNKSTEMQIELNSVRGRFETLQRRIAETQHQLQTHQSRMAAIRQALSTYDAKAAQSDSEAEGAVKNIEVLKKIHEGSLSVVEELEERRKKQQNSQRALIQAIEETHQQSDQDNLHLHKAELSLSKAQSDLSQMTDHLLNLYDLTYNDAISYRSESPIELGKADQEVLGLRSRIRELGTVNTTAIETYEAEMARYNELTAQRDDLLKAQEDLQGLIKRLLHQMESIFTTEFDKLGQYFKETFVRLFGGGQAELRLADESDPLNCGIDIIAQPPGKKLQLLSLLSGGERALTAIAILFAMLKLKPTPFCILDEIEAALDDSNISNFADYLSEYAKTTQFVVVTHRKGTMESCNTLYGVAMEEKGISRMVSVNLEDYTNT